MEDNEENYFIPENEQKACAQEYASPSGRYRLAVANFATKPGSWSYAQGKVYRVDEAEPIAIVQRNYSAFPFLFIEGHPNGRDYLVCGQDYQGQTVIELNTGRRVDRLSDGADEGFGFCWGDYRFDVASKILSVCGCHWACPYEFRFYDFSDPMSGWPELEVFDGEERDGIDEDARWPTFNPDGTITCYQTERNEDDDEDAEKRTLAATTVLRREGSRLIVTERWVSEKEQESRRKRKEANDAYDAWLKNFRETDPLYLAMLAGLKDGPFNPEEYMSVGQTYSGWCPDFPIVERRICKGIQKSASVSTSGVDNVTLDLEWGADIGPIKLTVFRDGKHVEDKFWMEHSVASIEAALAYAREQL